MPSDLLRPRVGVAGLTVALVLSACGADSAHDVVVVHSAAHRISSQPGGIGKVAASVDIPVSLEFRATVTSIQVAAGAKVTKGQPLITLDPGPLTTNLQVLRLRLQQAQASLTKQQASLAIAQSKNSSLIPELQAAISQLQGQIALDEQLVSIATGKTPTVVSPIDGYVQAITARPGVLVAAGAPLAELVNYARVSVTASLPVAIQSLVAAGMPADITLPDIGNLRVHGAVISVSPGATTTGTAFQVTADAQNTPNLDVRPGLNAYLQVTIDKPTEVAVPRLAVLNMDLDPTVVTIEGQVAHRHRVRLGASDERWVEITEGLQAGALCVIVGNQALDEGSVVRITKDEG